MSYKILTIPPFGKQLKRLAKKYPSLKQDFANFLESLKIVPDQGSPSGKNCFKIRIAIKSKGKGKRSGARVITSFVISNDTIYLLAIYDKSNKNNLSDRELKELLRYISE